MLKTEAKGEKRRYEPPVLLKLGELDKGIGACVGGSSPSSDDCTSGFYPGLFNCFNGEGASSADCDFGSGAAY